MIKKPNNIELLSYRIINICKAIELIELGVIELFGLLGYGIASCCKNAILRCTPPSILYKLYHQL